MTASTSRRETTVCVRGVDLFFREQGAGHPLLLISGLGGNVDMWGAAEERLSGVARTVAYDAPGTGRSSLPPWPLPIGALATLVRDAVAELGYDRVDVLGFSLGGLVAQQLAYQEPDRVRRLALVATVCGWGGMPGTREALAMITMPTPYHSRLLRDGTERLLSPVDRELIGRLTAFTDARLRHPPSLLGYAWQLWAGALWSSLPWLSRLRPPTLVVHGTEDELVPAANAVQLARLIPESRLQVVPGAGHLLVFDPAGGALPLLADFFGAPTLDDSAAWSTGMTVDDDEIVEAAFDRAPGAEPMRTLSRAYRRYMQRVSRNGAS